MGVEYSVEVQSLVARLMPSPGCAIGKRPFGQLCFVKKVRFCLQRG